MNNFNFVPTTVDNNQFLAYKQSGSYMTDYRNSSDMYAYLIKESSGKGVMTGNQLRQYLQKNGESFMMNFLDTTSNQFLNMQVPGAPNTCTGAMQSVIMNGGVPLVNDYGEQQLFQKDCPLPGQNCITQWLDTPLPQQSRYCS